MKAVRILGVLVLAASVLTACDDDDDATGVQVSDLAGAWTATQFEYTDVSGRTVPGSSQAPSIDAIDFGGTVTLNVGADGTFTGAINVPSLTPGDVPIGGTISLVDDDTLSIEFDAQTLAIVCPTPQTCLFDSFDADYSLSGDVLTFVNDDTSFDFAAIEPALGLEPAGPVDATLTVTLQR